MINVKVKSQQGAATLLLIVVVGLLVSTIIFTNYSSNESARAKMQTSHAIATSQAGAWHGLNIFSQYIQETESEDIKELVGDTLVFEVDQKKYTVKVNSITSNLKTLYVSVQYQDMRVKSSANIDAHITIKTKGNGNYFNGNQAFLMGDLKATGRVELKTNPYVASKLIIDGEVTSTSINLMGVDELRATGDVSFDSAEKVGFVKSNGDVSLVGGAQANTVRALGNISTTGGTGIIDAKANGYIDYRSSGESNSLVALGDITVSGGGGDVGLIHTNSDAYLLNKSVINNLRVTGDLEVKTKFKTSQLITEGEIDCPYYSQIEVTKNMHSNDEISNKCQTSGSGEILQNQNNYIDVIDAVTAVDLQKPRADVWKLREYANFQFLHDHQNGNIKVIVKNMSDIADGQYFLKNVQYANGSQELCVDENLINCTGKRICDGYSAPCVQLTKNADKNKSKWKITANQMTPGAYFFDANVDASIRYANMTLMVAGDVKTSGNFVLKSINYSTYDQLCTNVFTDNYPTNSDTSKTAKFSPAKNSNITGFYPTNYCDTQNFKVKNDVLGNSSIISGGVRDDLDANNTQVTGGDIAFNASTIVFGSVIAVDNIKTAGMTLIFGYLVALNLIDERVHDQTGNLIKPDENTFNANISIINNDSIEPEGFHAQLLPILDCDDEQDIKSCEFNDNDASDFGKSTIKTRNGISIKWAQYI